MNDLPEYYDRDSVITEKFLFISYSHEEKTLVRDSVNWLIGEGVRLWYDADLHNGDDWIAVAQRMIEHENCIGTVFFNSINSYISDPVAEERRFSLEKKQQWQQEGKAFHVFVVNIGKPSTMRLVKQVFDSLPDNDNIIGHAMTSSQLAVILALFSNSCIYSHLDADDPKGYLDGFLNDLIRTAPEAVNKASIAVEELGKLSGNYGISFKLGRYRVGDDDIALEWQFLASDDNDGVFLLKPILDERYGAGLVDWLNGEFKAAAFSAEEQGYLSGSLRLLTAAEAEQVGEKRLQSEQSWWLADVSGARQMVVREEGTVYKNGSINTRIQRGVRPVITVDLKVAKQLMN